jgi:hypothetical protein
MVFISFIAAVAIVSGMRSGKKSSNDGHDSPIHLTVIDPTAKNGKGNLSNPPVYDKNSMVFTEANLSPYLEATATGQLTVKYVSDSKKLEIVNNQFSEVYAYFCISSTGKVLSDGGVKLTSGESCQCLHVCSIVLDKGAMLQFRVTENISKRNAFHGAYTFIAGSTEPYSMGLRDTHESVIFKEQGIKIDRTPGDAFRIQRIKATSKQYAKHVYVVDNCTDSEDLVPEFELKKIGSFCYTPSAILTDQGKPAIAPKIYIKKGKETVWIAELKRILHIPPIPQPDVKTEAAIAPVAGGEGNAEESSAESNYHS